MMMETYEYPFLMHCVLFGLDPPIEVVTVPLSLWRKEAVLRDI